MIKTAKRERQPVFRVQQVRSQVEFSPFGEFRAEESWTPPVNLYQVDGAIVVCVDLAGVDRRQIDLRIVPGKLTISGTRLAPTPDRAASKGMRIVSMEIDHGKFSRTITIPDAVDIERSESEYRDGLLWIDLPLNRR